VTDFVNIKTDIPVGKTLQEYLVERFDGGFDFTLECVGSVDVMVGFCLFLWDAP
jgi:S-(hydroxymethyl)glutathione dehydrogenase/alcohol dehydrogenase